MNNIKEYIKTELLNREGGHDYWHALRVYNNAKLILKCSPEAKQNIVLTAALIHDIADDKFTSNTKTVYLNIETKLSQFKYSKKEIDNIICICKNMSFKGGLSSTTDESIEMKIVQDADRLDAIGAIGIARTFNYGGYKQREMYNPNIEPVKYNSKEEYRNSIAPTLNHFYEKLLKLKDGFHTQEAKKIAQKRHEFMLTFLDQFYNEWGDSAKRFSVG